MSLRGEISVAAMSSASLSLFSSAVASHQSVVSRQVLNSDRAAAAGQYK
jgi:hypothetical protein